MNNRSIQRWGALVTMVGVVIFTMVVITLHFIQSGYDPRHQLMSELALARHGWAMFLSFMGLASAMFGVQSAISVHGGSGGYRFLLSAVAIFFLAAGIFPLGAAPLIHISAITIAFVLVVLAMYLFPSNAGRAAYAAPRVISRPLAGGVAASVAMGRSVIPIGIGRRLAAACLLIWLMIVGWKLFRS